MHGRRLTLLDALLTLQMRRPVDDPERHALSLALAQVTGQLDQHTHLTDPTLADVYTALRDPTGQMAHELRIRGDDPQVLREQTAHLRAALAALVDGHLGGLFTPDDEHPAAVLDLAAPLATVDLSRLTSYGEDTTALVLTCLSTWAQAAIDNRDGRARMVIRDELWRALRAGGPTTIAKIDADLRLSRNDGVIHALATHRLSDFNTVGPAGSAAQTMAADLISSCAVKACLAQDLGPADHIRQAAGLTDNETRLLSTWGRTHAGRALWKVGTAGTHPIHLHLSDTEKRLFHTDERMQA